MYRTLIIILFLLAGVKLLSSEHCVNYSFTQLSIEQGLSQSTAQSILLDHKGTLWIGTKSGLNSYTQEGIKTYLHHSGDPHSLPSNYINHLTEDSLGNFWIATSKGLALYDDEQDQFNTVNSSIIYSSVGVEGGMWFGSENAIHCYDYKSKELKTIHIEKEEGKGINPVDYRIQKMLYLEDGKILIGTRKKGIYLYDCRIRQFTLLIPSSQNLLTSLYVTADHHIYTAFYGDGFYCYDRTGKMLKHYTKENSGLKNNYVLDMAEYNGNIWLATDGSGINLFTPRTFQFSQLQHIVGDYSSLPVNSITLLYKDMKDNLWAGSVRGGIFSIKETYIKTYKEAILNNTNGLSEQSVISLYEEKDGKVWIGTDGGGINLYDPSTDKFIHFPSTYGDKVVSIAEVSETELMVSLYTKGIFLFNKKTHKYRPFTIVDEETNKKECFYGYLPLANQVADGKIYIISCGTYVYHTHDHTFSRMQTDRDYDFSNDALCLSYSNDRFSLLKCAHQAFWVDQKSDSIRLLFELEKDELITSMSYDNNRMIWTSTNKGLGFFDLESQKYHRIRTRLFNGISYLIADGKGRLWICAQNHLYSYIIKENRFILWNSSDGFPPNEILFAYQKQSNRDYIYLGGSEGLVKINTDIPYTETQIPEIYLSEILFNGSPSLKKVKENTIKIPWNYNSLSVHFRIKNRDVFQKYLLQYTIEGRGKQSIETYDPVLNLSSLSAGNYSIWVSCNTKNGNRTPSKQLIHIIVTPPWYKTVWFIGVAAVLFIIMTASIGYIHYRRKERNMKGNVNYFLQAVLNDMLSSKEEKQRGEEDNCAETPLSDISSKEDDSRLEETGQQTQAKNSKEDEEFLNKLNMLIHENMAGGELSIKFLTDKLAMSRASLYNKVKFLTGLGVNDYINRLRIEKSVFLLTNTNMNINEISYEVGFSYPRYFSTSFKQIKGMILGTNP
jgi:ligand-binding sensor domain-containing protein/AraC-like DNA-binding protein